MAPLPNGAGLLGTALILLGLNATRLRLGILARRATTRAGLLALLSGGLLLLLGVWGVSVEIPLFEAALILLGVDVLARLRRQATRGPDNVPL